MKAEAERAGQFYVNQRWLGGILTNYKTISKRIKRISEIEKMEEDGLFDVLPKKKLLNLKEYDRLIKFLGGIRDMKSMPQALFVVDPRKERNAIAEARKLNIQSLVLLTLTVILMKLITLSQQTMMRFVPLNY